MPAFQVVVRYGVFSLFVLSALVALASWLVRTRRLSPFGPVGRALRGASEPVLRPVERRLVRLGGNPVHAGWWLVVVVAAGGVLLLSLLDWIIHTVGSVVGSVANGPRGVVLLLIPLAYWVLVAALMLRVIASWFGITRDRKSTRLNSSHGYISYAVFCLQKKMDRTSPGPDSRKPPT